MGRPPQRRVLDTRRFDPYATTSGDLAAHCTPAYPGRVGRGEILLFTYGTLQQPEVQLDTFGRVIDGEPDVLSGYTIDYVDIDDPRVVEVSGRRNHPILRATGSALDKVVGRALALTQDELDAADEYEVDHYHRERVTLDSGRSAWVYIAG